MNGLRCTFYRVIWMIGCLLFSGTVKIVSAADSSVQEAVSQTMDLSKPDTYLQFIKLIRGYFLDNLPHVCLALLIFVVGRMVVNWGIRLTQKAMEKANVEATLRRFLEKTLYYTLMVGVLIAAAAELGLETTSFLAIVGAAGLAIGLALKDSLSNFASGVMIILFRPFTVGDVVTLAGITGKVFQVDMFSTVIHTADNQRQIIPNATITTSVITNITVEKTRRIDLLVGIGYDDDIALAKKSIKRLLAADPRILTDPPPVIGVAALGASSVDIAVRPWVQTADYWNVQSDLLEAIKNDFDNQGISFPYPQQDVHMYQHAVQK